MEIDIDFPYRKFREGTGMVTDWHYRFKLPIGYRPNPNGRLSVILKLGY